MVSGSVENPNGPLYYLGMERKPIGEIIRELRTAKGWSQQRLAEPVGTTYQQIYRHEQADSIEANRLLKIALALEAPLSAFLGPEVRALEGMPGGSEDQAMTAKERAEADQLLKLDADGRRLVALYLRLPEAERRQLLQEAGKIGIASGVVEWR
jgi:transcriptional regulator with XRE-family HTH domain